jgi:hypothetical protein
MTSEEQCASSQGTDGVFISGSSQVQQSARIMLWVTIISANFLRTAYSEVHKKVQDENG